MVFKMTSRRVPAARIVVRAAHSLESRGLVDRNRACTILILLAWIFDSGTLSGEVVCPSSRRRRVGDGRVQRVGRGRHRGKHQVRPSETPLSGLRARTATTRDCLGCVIRLTKA